MVSYFLLPTGIHNAASLFLLFKFRVLFVCLLVVVFVVVLFLFLEENRKLGINRLQFSLRKCALSNRYFSLYTQEIFDVLDLVYVSVLLYCMVEKETDICSHTKCRLQNT